MRSHAPREQFLASLASALKVDRHYADQVFSPAGLTIKRDVDLATASKQVHALEALYCVCKIIDNSSGQVVNAESRAAATTVRASETSHYFREQVLDRSADWRLLPRFNVYLAGVFLLTVITWFVGRSVALVISYAIYFLIAIFTGVNPLLTSQNAMLVLPVGFCLLLIPALFVSELSPSRRISERELFYLLGHVILFGTSIVSAVALLFELQLNHRLLIIAPVVEMIGAPIGLFLVWSSRAPKEARD